MDRNLFLAVALSMGVYVAWFSFVERKAVPPQPAPAAGSPAAAISPSSDKSPTAAQTPVRVSNEPPQEEVKLEVPEAEVRINPYGAALSSFKFQGPLGQVELVPQPVPGFFSTWPDLSFKRVKSAWPHSAAFEAKHPAGLTVRKVYRFGDPAELNLLRVEIKNTSKKSVEVPPWELVVGPGLGTVKSEEAENPDLLRAIGLFPPPQGRKVDRLEELDAEVRDWRWLAVDNRYFIVAAWPERKEFESYAVEEVGADKRKQPLLRVAAKKETLAPGAVTIHDIPFYLGPKAYLRVQGMKVGLERAVDFGWFDTLGRWILKVLHSIHTHVGNYGWAIIILTVLLQIALFPLTYKSLKAASAMKKIQPEIARLQQKYSRDPQRLNQEMMALYRSKGANPLGGCLPMLLQLPIFVALFNALRNSWELHGSPWVGWIRDLSAHDPYYVLPIIMGGVMFFQNKMTMIQTADPAQAKIMTFMPLIFTFMFLKFPAGLVLYWLTSSLLSFGQTVALKDRV